MKKRIIWVLVVVFVMSLLAACGPNYYDELEVISTDMETLTDEWVAFGESIGDRTAGLETIEEMNAVFTDLAAETGEYAEKYEALDVRVDAIKDGISEEDYTTVKESLASIIEAIRGMQNEILAAMVEE